MQPVTIRDVVEADIPMPTRSKVSFPAFSYKQAFPEAGDRPEIVINRFGEAPMLKDLGSMPADWRKHYPDALPPVAQRLPRNPAVVVGPDGLGKYGGVWRRCTYEIWDFTHKVCYESLTRHDPSGRIQPCLAYKWEVSDDWRQFTFYLRKGHKWSDGAPFTGHDITWVCNELIGWGYWSIPPDWMQATDGFKLLYEDDVADWKKLATRIVEHASLPEPSVGGQIKKLAPTRLWKQIEQTASGRGDDQTHWWIANGLNELFLRSEFYYAKAFAKTDLQADLNAIRKIGASRLSNDQMDQLLGLLMRKDLLRRLKDEPDKLERAEIKRLNLSLFRTAYRDLVAAPVRRRVKVEAVPDENGDDSHIVRFTFRRPNSIFLEQTTTFMFYVGLFGVPRHATAPLHPAGSKKLEPMDIWQWQDLFDTIREQAQGDKPSPGKQLWRLLDEPVRKKIESDPPADDSPESYKAELIGAINRALGNAEFFDTKAWTIADIESRRKRMCRDLPLSKVLWYTTDRAIYRTLLIVEDLMRRFQRGGPASLTAGERLKLNMVVFRSAYSLDSRRPMVMPSRYDSLDRAASDERGKWTRWRQRIRNLRDYHPVRNPHFPVLGAWRIVDEPNTPVMLAVRNPYYYRVDARGNQLPYIDAVRTKIVPGKAARTAELCSGNVDFQVRKITFDQLKPLMDSAKQGGYEVRLWANDYCGEVSFNCLQAHREETYRRLQDDPNFRHALSLAINRQEIIDKVFAGMARPAQFSVPAGSPYYNDRMAKAFIEYDSRRANRLLDAMGLQKRDPNGIRLLPDGRPLVMEVNTVSDRDVPLPAIRLACEHWQRIGVDARLRLRERQLLYRMEEMGISDMRAHGDGGGFFGPLPPGCYHCSHAAEAVQWYQWASYIYSKGDVGWLPPSRIWELERMWERFVTAPNQAEKMKHWQAITNRFAADLPIIGVCTSPGKVVLVKKSFKNVPRLALAGWIAHEPGNCCPESFFFDTPQR